MQTATNMTNDVQVRASVKLLNGCSVLQVVLTTTRGERGGERRDGDGQRQKRTQQAECRYALMVVLLP